MRENDDIPSNMMNICQEELAHERQLREFFKALIRKATLEDAHDWIDRYTVNLLKTRQRVQRLTARRSKLLSKMPMK